MGCWIIVPGRVDDIEFQLVTGRHRDYSDSEDLSVSRSLDVRTAFAREFGLIGL